MAEVDDLQIAFNVAALVTSLPRHSPLHAILINSLEKDLHSSAVTLASHFSVSTRYFYQVTTTQHLQQHALLHMQAPPYITRERISMDDVEMMHRWLRNVTEPAKGVRSTFAPWKHNIEVLVKHLQYISDNALYPSTPHTLKNLERNHIARKYFSESGMSCIFSKPLNTDTCVRNATERRN